MLLRQETDHDRDAIFAVHTAAFAGHLGRDPAQQAPEAPLVDDLRADGDVVPGLSIVAERDGAIVGHVVCSRGDLAGTPAVGLGPIGVLPDVQGDGVGTALMHAAIAAADALGEPAIVLVGEPRFYGRFGFVAASEHGVESPDPAWGRYFQIRTLSSWPDGLRGAWTYPPAFERVE